MPRKDVDAMIDAMPLHTKIGALVSALILRTPDPTGTVVSLVGLIAVMTRCLPDRNQCIVADNLRDLADNLEHAAMPVPVR